MADEKSSIFTKKASHKLRSPDDLDEYVRVTNPSIWVVLAACAVLLIGLFAWGFFGTAETKVDATATCAKGEVVAFLSADSASKLRVGDPANVSGELMKVESVSAVPLSREEAREIVGSDYLAATIVGEDWTYLVRFEGDGAIVAEGVPLPTSVTTERIAPISIIFGDAA